MALILLIFSLYSVDQPDIDVPGHGVFNIQLRFGPGGEVLGLVHVGIWNRLGLGISYGAENLIGAGDPAVYELPGVQIRIVALEEGVLPPAVILGFDNQGYGGYDGTRYTIRSKGLYCLAGKTFFYPNIVFSPSLGVNYCFEADDQLDLFMGLKIQFGSSTALLLDYSPNFKDDLDRNKGYFNTSLRFIFHDEVFFEFALRDILNNSIEDQQLNRLIKIGYKNSF